jgi:hypothetical protein
LRRFIRSDRRGDNCATLLRVCVQAPSCRQSLRRCHSTAMAIMACWPGSKSCRRSNSPA